MSRNIATGIDIGTYSINIAVLELFKNESRPKILALVSKTSSGLRKGNVTDIKSISTNIGTAIREAERQSKVSIKKRVYLGVGGTTLSSVFSKGLIAISRADGEITDYDIKRVIRQSEVNIPKISNRSIIHTIPLQFNIDKDISIRDPVGMKGNKLEIDTVFIVCLTQHLNNLIKSVESNGVNVEDVIASPLANARAILNRRQKEVGSLILDIGAETTSVIVFEEDIPISVAVFPIGSEHITNDIALCLQISLEEAERMKRSYGIDNATTRKISHIVEARLNDILDLVSGHLKKINKNEMLPAGVVLAGEGSKLPNLPSFIKRDLKIPAEIGSCNFLKENIGSKWSCAIGLALLGLDENPQINLGFAMANRAKNFIVKWLKSFLP
jgi:cell division protein FtsA